MSFKGLLFNVGICGLAVIGGVFASRKPWQVFAEQRARTAQQVSEMKKSEARREELVRQEAYVRSSVGREEMARRQGFMKPEERPAPKR